MPDVLMLTIDDYANSGWRYMKSLHSMGIDVWMLKAVLHPMWYPEQALLHPALMKARGDGFVYDAPELTELMREAKVLHYVHSWLIRSGTDPRERKVVFQHGGSLYRQNHENINRVLAPIVDATIIETPDLLGLGAEHEQWIPAPVDTGFLRPEFDRTTDKLKIGHFPSNPVAKGTPEILEVIEKLRADDTVAERFEYVGFEGVDKPPIITWTENLKRVRACDIVIETCAREQAGRPMGQWGATALEACALGKVCVTNARYDDEYRERFGDHALVIANDGAELEAALRRLLTMPDGELDQMRRAARAWVEEKHGFEAIGRRMVDEVYQHLL